MTDQTNIGNMKFAIALCHTSVTEADASLRCMLNRPADLLVICKLMDEYLESMNADQVSRRSMIARYTKRAAKALGKTEYRCNVKNCGNGQCVHQVLDERCPHCANNMVLVTTNGHQFCASPDQVCDYEVFADADTGK